MKIKHDYAGEGNDSGGVAQHHRDHEDNNQKYISNFLQLSKKKYFVLARSIKKTKWK